MAIISALGYPAYSAKLDVPLFTADISHKVPPNRVMTNSMAFQHAKDAVGGLGDRYLPRITTDAPQVSDSGP